MKKIHYSIATLIITLGLASPWVLHAENEPETIHENQEEQLLRLSEAFGHFIGRNLNNPGIQFDLEKLIKGIRDGATGKPAPMDDQEYEQIMAMHQAKAYHELSQKNLDAAKEFLTNNVTNPDVVELEDGKLQYQILEKGQGEKVEEEGAPQIYLSAKLLDDTVFASSDEAGEPITLPLDQAIPGLHKGVVGMLEGEKRRIFVHPDLGYGTSGHLPPNSLLIFDIEIVKVQSPEENDKG